MSRKRHCSNLSHTQCSLLQSLAYLSNGSLDGFTLGTLGCQLSSHCRPLLWITLYTHLHTDRNGGWQYASLPFCDLVNLLLALLLQCVGIHVSQSAQTCFTKKASCSTAKFRNSIAGLPIPGRCSIACLQGSKRPRSILFEAI